MLLYGSITCYYRGI